MAGLGLKPATIRAWYRNPGRSLNERALARIGGLLGLTYEEAKAQAGGRSAEEKQRANGARLASEVPLDDAARAARASSGGKAGRGRVRPRDVVERATAAREERGFSTAQANRMRADGATVSGKLRRSLGGRLRHESSPSTERIDEWVADAARRFGMKPEAVRGEWHAPLVQRGLVHGGGRPKVTGRREALLALMAELGVDPAGRIPVTFWEAALQRLATIEAKPPQAEETIRRWWQANKP